MRPSELLDMEAECATLGCLLADVSGWEHASVLEPGDFANHAHAQIFSAIRRLCVAQRPVDHLLVADELKAMGCLAAVGGPAYLMHLDQRAPVLANVAEYAAAVKAMALRRDVLARAKALAEAACNPAVEPGAAALEFSGALAKLGASGADRIMTGHDVVERLRVRLDKVQRGEVLPVIPTGIKVWDYLLGGLQPGFLTVLGARPSAGKTATELSMALNLARMYADTSGRYGRTGIVWLEDPVEAMGRRGLAYTSGVPVWRLAKEVLTGPALEMAGLGLVDLDDLIGDAWRVFEGTRVSERQLDVVLRQMVVRHGCKVLMVDHLGEVEADYSRARGARDLAVREVVRVCRDVAKDLDVAMVLILHLTRSASKDKDQRQQRPTLESGGETSAIEKMARTMVYLWDDPEHPGYVAAHVPKQMEGEKGFDFYMRMNKSAALIDSMGGKAPDGVRGYTDASSTEGVSFYSTQREEEKAA